MFYFVVSEMTGCQVDHCCRQLQRVLNDAARVITGTRKFDRGLGQILHDQLLGLTFPTGFFSS